jgi:predicted DNA-binding ribbon-helix-helix protein
MFAEMIRHICKVLVQQHHVARIQRGHRNQTRLLSRIFYIELCYTFERKGSFLLKEFNRYQFSALIKELVKPVRHKLVNLQSHSRLLCLQ